MHENPPSIEFPTDDEEHARRIRVEAQRLANLGSGEGMFWADRSAGWLKVPPADFRKFVEDTIKHKEKQASEQKAEERRKEKHLEQQRAAAEREDRKREREQERIDKEAARKRKDMEKAFAALVKLPSGQFEAQLAELAKRFGEDPATLREEFEAFTDGGVTLGDLLTPAIPEIWNVVPWDEPVDVAVLLQGVDDQTKKYVVIGVHYRTAAVLWTAMDWIHNEIATHSPILDIVSVDEGSGKTELMGALGLLVQRPYHGAEFTGPNIYALSIVISQP